ncbi:MAG: penicillin-binding protein [Rhodospirillaceae bacterium]|nr:penicillin-binding protein [Rhodospirillaceae bacterium]
MLRFIYIVFCSLVIVCTFASVVIGWVFFEFGKGLPDYRQLANYQPSVMSRVYAGDGRLIEEYAVEGRVFVPFSSIPSKLVLAFLSSEDKNFYSHSGIDFFGIARAIYTNFKARFNDRRMIGASTITQQVAKNFLLSNEYSFDRKIKEAILALRIERAFTKNHIIELYLNEIYLGFGSYGVAAASMNYFNKSLDELTLSEMAFLAGLPKAPNNYHPIKNALAAKERRNYVLRRMMEDNYITDSELNSARGIEIITKSRNQTAYVSGGEYFAEQVRRELIERFGSDELYRGGLAVRTSLDPRLQVIADNVLREGLIKYDRRHGWRGPLSTVPDGENLSHYLREFQRPKGGLRKWKLAVVNSVTKSSATIEILGDGIGTVRLVDLKWARKWLPEQKVGSSVKSVGEVLSYGDIIFVEPTVGRRASKSQQSPVYDLRQTPKIEGALIALDPHTGRIYAMTGGFSYGASEFNRATQAKRQPGSAFKPFVYLAALDSGYTPSTLVLDAPFVIDQGPGLPKWKPKNYSGRYYGNSTLRTGIEKSQNLMTVRLAQAIGMEKVGAYAKKFGITDNLPTNLSAALGSEETTLIKITAAYAMILNGGRSINSTLIDRVQDRNGKTIYKSDKRVCEECLQNEFTGGVPPSVKDNREQLSDPVSTYQMVSILQGVVDRGTGRSVSAVGKILAGKTGTSNDSFDTWFLGFSPNLVVGVFVGFDVPQTLGTKETGSSVAAPIFRDFMSKSLARTATPPFKIPKDVILVRVDPVSGLVAQPGSRRTIIEAFKKNTSPERSRSLNMLNELDGKGALISDQPSAGGLY